MTNQDSALTYIHRGWHVLPVHTPIAGTCSCGNVACSSIGKHPRTRQGVKDATTSETQVRKWWTEHPGANIGIATGVDSGLVVIDLDNAGDKDGEKNFAMLGAAFGGLPVTLTARTPNGCHLFFRHPGVTLKNSVSQLALGVDVRADGGYVVAPPSRHASGRMYQWKNEGSPIAELPPWLLQRLEHGAATHAKERTENDVMQGGDAIIEGTRNDKLYRIGCSLRGQLAMEDADILQRLMLYNASKCEPPLDEAEVRRIAQSVCEHPPENGGKKSLKRQERTPLYWFKQNVREFSADLNIQRMTDYQLGWHTKLHVYAWQNAGILPADDSTLWRLAGAKSRKAFERDSALVLSEYQPATLLGQTVLLNRKMAAEYADTLDLWLKVKAAGEANRDRMKAMASLASSLNGSGSQTTIQ